MKNRIDTGAVFIAACLFITWLSGCAGASNTPETSYYHGDSEMVDARVENLLGQMTLEEKIDYIGGYNQFYIRPMPRLGLPEIKMADGPVGVRNYGPSTAYPASIALAATWNAELAGEFGRAIGRDSRARGVHILLAPGVNIYRSPLCGRNFEYQGEDPFLAGTLASETIRGVQGQDVLATVKHYVANNQEYERHHVSSEIDERTLREIYLPAFEAAVKDADVACVMNAYNLVNGIHCTEHSYLNNEILKSQWGFDGILMSDWNSVYDAVGAANGGLDLEMPSGKFMNRENLLPAIESGEVSEATIDDKVRRILRMIVQAGFLDRPQLDDSIPQDDPASAEVALQIAREGIVLLKNEGGALPLDESQVKTLAVIGPNAEPEMVRGGGSSWVTPFHSVSALEGIRTRAGDKVKVVYESGNAYADVEQMAEVSRYEHVTDDESVVPGLAATYYDNIELGGEPVFKRVDSTIRFNWSRRGPGELEDEGFSVRWTGRITPEAGGKHWFVARADDGIRVWLDGELIIDDWSDHAARLRDATRDLEAGRAYDIRIEYYQNLGGAIAEFGWTSVGEDRQAKAIEAARGADAVVVCAGLNDTFEHEGADRPFELPGDQDRLIKEVLVVNPNTIVVLNAGGAVDMMGWVDHTPAVLQAWYPGQEGGTALAEILFGDVNPSGKLPATFEKRLEDNPSYEHYHSADGKTTVYEEGVFVGYRGFDKHEIEPLFCFGHGLSYTTFEYSDLSIKTDGRTAQVSFRVENTGSRAGSEVAQVYMKDVKASVPRPPKELKGFARVTVQPGESQAVTIDLDERAFSYYDTENARWTVEPGDFEVLVGSSSRDIRLQGDMALE